MITLQYGPNRHLLIECAQKKKKTTAPTHTTSRHMVNFDADHDNWFVNEFAVNRVEFNKIGKHRISTIDSFNWIINCAIKETQRKICANLIRAHFDGDDDNNGMTISVQCASKSNSIRMQWWTSLMAARYADAIATNSHQSAIFENDCVLNNCDELVCLFILYAYWMYDPKKMCQSQTFPKRPLTESHNIKDIISWYLWTLIRIELPTSKKHYLLKGIGNFVSIRHVRQLRSMNSCSLIFLASYFEFRFIAIVSTTAAAAVVVVVVVAVYAISAHFLRT